MSRALVSARHLCAIPRWSTRAYSAVAESAPSAGIPPRGNNPVYDASLDILASYRAGKQESIKALREAAKGNSAKYRGRLLKKRVAALEIMADKNDPAVLHAYKTEKIDLSRPVFKYLRQNDFREKDIPKLLERSNDMFVLPDVLPMSFVPKANVSIQFPSTPEEIVPGDLLSAATTIAKPEINVVDFTGGKALYTLMLVDPDDPNVVTGDYNTRCHWLLANVPLSLEGTLVAGGDECVPYLPPHPARGTKAHRYVLLVLRQPKSAPLTDLPSLVERKIDIDRWVRNHKLEHRGWSFFRVKWEADTIDQIYREHLGTTAPVYGQWQNAESLGIDIGEVMRLRRVVAAAIPEE